jgi:hypothetical protein
MTQVHKAAEQRTNPKSEEKNSLATVRAAAQKLHGAITDATAKRGEAMKADLLAIPHKAKAVAESVKESLGAQGAASKKHLTAASTPEFRSRHGARSFLPPQGRHRREGTVFGPPPSRVPLPRAEAGPREAFGPGAPPASLTRARRACWLGAARGRTMYG